MDADQPNTFQRLLGPVLVAGLLILVSVVFLPLDPVDRRLVAFCVMVALVALGFAGVLVHLVRGVVPMRGRWLVRAREPGAFWGVWALQAAADLFCAILLVLMRPVG